MRRFWRLLSYATAVVAALVCAVILALWIRSGFVSDFLFYTHFKYEGAWLHWTSGQIATGQGGIGFTSDTQAVPAAWGPRMIPGVRPPHHGTRGPLYPDFHFGRGKARWGFQFRHLTGPPRGNLPPPNALQIIVPLWFLLAVFAVATISGFRLSRTRNRRPKGVCRECGYDLRATPERCPECGAVPVGEMSRG